MDYKFRFTFQDGEEPTQELVKELLGMIMIAPENYTFGIEILDKRGEHTHKHMHVHWTTADTTKFGTLRKRIQVWAGREENKRYVGDRKGAALYSFTLEKVLEEHSRFFRYPWKQYSSQIKLINDYHRFGLDLTSWKKTNDEVDIERKLAYEEWSMGVTRNKAARDKLLKKQEGREELFLYIEEAKKEMEKKFEGYKMTEHDILTTILKYHVDKEKSANKNTVLGYMYTACLKFGILTYGQLATRWLE